VLELRNERVERAVPMVWRAKIAKAHMRLALKPRQQAFGDARLADAWLAGKQNDPTLAELGLIPTTQQQPDLLVSADERGQRPGAARLEAAHSGHLAAHLPRFRRLLQPLEPFGSKRAAIEHPAHQPPRAGRDHDLAGGGHGLQMDRQIWRLADRKTPPGLAGPHLFADDDEAGGDADACLRGRIEPGLQRANQVDEHKAGADRPLGVVLMSSGVAEINEHAVALVLGDKSIKSRRHISGRFAERTDPLAKIFRINICRQGVVGHPASHDRELPPLRLGGAAWRG
jgi:hypothetical protein